METNNINASLDRNRLDLVGSDEMSPARMFRLLSFGRYEPLLTLTVFLNLQFINDLARNYCYQRRPLKFWDLGEDLALIIQQINSNRSNADPKVIVAERVLQEDTRFLEYYLKFAVEYIRDDDSNLEILPRSLQREYLHTNLTTTRAVLLKIPEESYCRALRGYLIYSLQISAQRLLSTTRDRYGNIRLQYIGLLYRSPQQSNESNNKLFHQSTFIMKGVILELRVDDTSSEDSTFCLCADCCYNRVLTIEAPADRVYSIFEYSMLRN